MCSAMLFVFELKPGQTKVEKFDKSLGDGPNPTMWFGKPIVQHEISMRLECKANTKYVIMLVTR